MAEALSELRCSRDHRAESQASLQPTTDGQPPGAARRASAAALSGLGRTQVACGVGARRRGITPNTIHRILLRHDLVREEERHPPATQRFERSRPNELWQMDFKGPKAWPQPMGPLSVLDDHSRYLIVLAANGSTHGEPVRERLEEAFLRCGVPEEMLMDHGTPWWGMQSSSGQTRLSLWLMRQGIRLNWSGIRHPQTQGKWSVSMDRYNGH